MSHLVKKGICVGTTPRFHVIYTRGTPYVAMFADTWDQSVLRF